MARAATNTRFRAPTPMQAGLVSTRLHWSDIFTARGLSLRILVAVVRIPVVVQLRETGTAELPAFSWPHEQRTAA